MTIYGQLTYHDIDGLGQRSLRGDELRSGRVLASVVERRASSLVLARPVDGPITIEDECAIGTPQSCATVMSGEESATRRNHIESKNREQDREKKMNNNRWLPIYYPHALVIFILRQKKWNKDDENKI